MSIRIKNGAIVYKSSSLDLLYRIIVLSHLSRSGFPHGRRISKTKRRRRNLEYYFINALEPQKALVCLNLFHTIFLTSANDLSWLYRFRKSTIGTTPILFPAANISQIERIGVFFYSLASGYAVKTGIDFTSYLEY